MYVYGQVFSVAIEHPRISQEKTGGILGPIYEKTGQIHPGIKKNFIIIMNFEAEKIKSITGSTN